MGKSFDRPGHWWWLFLLLSLALSAPRLVGISSFALTGDEQLMMDIAVSANARGLPSDHGLRSSRGVYYGPFSVWVYQGLLLFTKDVGVMRFCAVVAQSLAFAVGLFVVARLCPFLTPFVGLLPFLSPYFAFFSRLIWDFHAPLAVLAFASYLYFLRTDRFIFAFLAGLVLTLGVLDHLKGLSPLAAIAVHGVLFRRSYLMRKWRPVAVSLGVYLALMAPYLTHVLHNHEPVPFRFGGLASLGFSLTGALLFSAIDINRYTGIGWYAFGDGSDVILWISYLTALAYLFSFGGLIEMGRYVRANARGKSQFELEFCSLCLLALLFFSALNLVMGLVSYPHYYCPVWIYFFAMVWYFVTRHGSNRFLKGAVAVYVLALVVTGAKLIVDLKLNW